MLDKLLEKGYHINALNIGCMSAGAGRKKLTDSVFASQEEIAVFRKLISEGVDVYIQMVYSESKIRLSDLIN